MSAIVTVVVFLLIAMGVIPPVFPLISAIVIGVTIVLGLILFIYNLSSIAWILGGAASGFFYSLMLILTLYYSGIHGIIGSSNPADVSLLDIAILSLLFTIVMGSPLGLRTLLSNINRASEIDKRVPSIDKLTSLLEKFIRNFQDRCPWPKTKKSKE